MAKLPTNVTYFLREDYPTANLKGEEIKVFSAYPAYQESKSRSGYVNPKTQYLYQRRFYTKQALTIYNSEKAK